MKYRNLISCLAFWSMASCSCVDAVCQTKIETSQQQDSKTQHQRTRKLILKFFPDLDKDTVDGWVDSYSSMTEAELTQLLQQRQILGADGSNFSGMKLDLPTFHLDHTTKPQSSATPPATGSPVQRAIKIVKANLFGLRVAGHRGRTFYFTHADHVNEQLGTLALHESWQLMPGIKHRTRRNLDIAILNQEDLMFRLEPGCLLTRSGHFVRLPDGRLGQKVAGKNLAISPEVVVPESAMSYRIQSDGSIVSTAESSNEQRLGQISVVRITNRQHLKSTNGVYFTVTEGMQPIAFQSTEKLTVATGVLELSNVDASAQQNLLDLLQTMQQASLLND
ncbi:MAG: hypothetical protein ABJZ55_21785 [Fuerstiella sp.]